MRINFKWWRAIKEYDGLQDEVAILKTTVAELEQKTLELEAALVARSNNESSMTQVMKHIDMRVNSTGYTSTLRKRPGESHEDLMNRYRDDA